MAGKGKIIRGALEGLTDAISKVLPDDIANLPSYKESVRAFKRSLMGDEEGLSVAEMKKIPDAEVDAEDLFVYGFENEKDIFRGNRDPFDDWAAEEIDLQDFQKIHSPTPEQMKYGTEGDPVYPLDFRWPTMHPTSGTEFLGGANYPLDPRSYVLRDLEVNYGLSKPEIMDYLKKNDLLEDASDGSLGSGSAKNTAKRTFDFNEQQIQALKDAFASGDPNNPIVKRVRGALADLADEDDLVEVTPEMIYGKSN
jgi:hypothetical protein